MVPKIWTLSSHGKGIEKNETFSPPLIKFFGEDILIVLALLLEKKKKRERKDET